MDASQQVNVVSRRLESEVVVLVLVDRFLCFIVDVRVARLVLLVLVRLCVGAVFGDLDSEPYSLTTLVSSAGLSSSPAAKEPPCRPGRSALGASAELRCSVWSSQ